MNQTTTDGTTPLFIAVQKGRLPVVQLLLDHEAAVNQADNFGTTLLIIAAQIGYLPVVVQLLLDRRPL